MAMTIGIVLGVLLLMYLLMKNNHLKFENKHLKKRKREAENTLSIYFNQLLQYRDVLIRNNITVDNNQMPTEQKDVPFTVDGILDEIAEKGLDNISKDKLDFLNKQHGKDETNS